ncbi:hypothetical protein KTR66_20365 [Roseococcus sp. SDR]|uniref:hypothetical protein n=1 Tax=Roseococcus sp. SDR TaxID=2835532 RepID=UPI001BCBF13E|nr:hypothetical protein [Roseococcus sp. SDR]MBS7792358.1 hypothetical protein [Roseococcus sp. SDR]MBV1847672.1 hypothetical protein [Roseococcus sp. SDR]
MKPAAPLLLLLALAAPAMAQERPTLTPARDVAVTYRVTAEGAPPGEMRMSWLAQRRLMRMDMPGDQGFIVLDMGGGTAFMAMAAQRMILDMPATPIAARMAPSAEARFTREGPARIANTDCVNWRVEEQGQAARICLTTDGVMLRSETLSRNATGPVPGLLEAIQVSFGPQDAARFQRPSGYQNLQLPPPAQIGAGGMPRGTAIPPPGLNMPGR